MGLVKKCDARDFLSAGGNKSQHSFRQVCQADRASSTGIALDGTRAIRPTFAEDFMTEHSRARVQIALIGIASGAGTAPNEAQQSAQSFGFPS
jgi:hypothetical protein